MTTSLSLALSEFAAWLVTGTSISTYLGQALVRLITRLIMEAR